MPLSESADRSVQPVRDDIVTVELEVGMAADAAERERVRAADPVSLLHGSEPERLSRIHASTWGFLDPGAGGRGGDDPPPIPHCRTLEESAKGDVHASEA